MQPDPFPGSVTPGIRLLENGTVTHKSQCGRIDRAIRPHIGASNHSKSPRPPVPRGSWESSVGYFSIPGEAASRIKFVPEGPTLGWRRPARDLDGEFDPGSGRTLAARLTHASRTRRGASAPWRVANGCVTREQPASETGITQGNLG